MCARTHVGSRLGAPANELVRSVFWFSSLFKKSLFRACQLFLFYSLALRRWDAALERFHPVVLFFFLIWCGLVFYELSECVCVNAYSALMGLFMTILLKHLGVHYCPYFHMNCFLRKWSFKIIFFLISRAVWHTVVLLCNCCLGSESSAFADLLLPPRHWFRCWISRTGGWELGCMGQAPLSLFAPHFWRPPFSPLIPPKIRDLMRKP